MQFSATASMAYLSQPDVRLINGPSQNVGDYFTASAKADLSYRWAKRFSTVTSLSYNSLLYTETTQQTGNFYQTTFGTEGRYLWSSRLTVLGEVRYGLTTYDQSPELDSTTTYLLIGAEYALSSRMNATLRVGEAMRSFTNASMGGASSAAPYLESTLSWRFNPTGFLSWNSRFGFEEPPNAQSEVLGFRTGLSAVQAFSARLRGSAGLTYVHRTTTNDTAQTDFTEQAFDLNVGLEYAYSKRLSLNASYVFTDSFSDNKSSDYYRNRIFLGAEYSF
jgi:opacity protein-like surface antigen